MVVVIVVLISFLITFILMPWIISFSRSRGLFDSFEGNNLKVHKSPIPFLGGIGIFAGYLIALAYIGITSEDAGELLAIIICSTLIVTIGLWDDLKNIKPTIRLGWHLIAALLSIWFGFRIPMDYITIPLTVFLIVGSINAVNLFDGLDGLAGGVVSISLTGFCVLFYLQGDRIYLALSFALLGAVLGFLPYNFNPARIFMGDNGSTFLGYMLSILAIKISSSASGSLKIFAISVVFIGLPVIDTLMALIRRAVKGRPIFIGDRSHIYDQLVDRGFSVKKTALICYSIQTLLVSGGLYLFYSSIHLQ